MNGKYLLLGSNIGDRLENISYAKKNIRERIGVIDIESPVYITSPWGTTSQPDYYNQVIRVITGLEPDNLLEAIAGLETDMGRKRNQKWDNRIIDIDILFYDDRIVDEPHLKIPHPLIPDRLFVLIPMADIAAEEVHPVLNVPIRELLEMTTDKGRVIKLVD